MTVTRAQRRRMKSGARPAAALMAARCYDFHAGGALVPITAPPAVAALTRAFTLLLRFGGKPVAVPIAEHEARGFPRWRADVAAGGVTWLAVGIDGKGGAVTRCKVVLSRICSAPSARLGHLAFEGQGAFSSQC